jgi:hypothetical protein
LLNAEAEKICGATWRRRELFKRRDLLQDNNNDNNKNNNNSKMVPPSGGLGKPDLSPGLPIVRLPSGAAVRLLLTFTRKAPGLLSRRIFSLVVI